MNNQNENQISWKEIIQATLGLYLFVAWLFAPGLVIRYLRSLF